MPTAPKMMDCESRNRLRHQSNWSSAADGAAAEATCAFLTSQGTSGNLRGQQQQKKLQPGRGRQTAIASSSCGLAAFVVICICLVQHPVVALSSAAAAAAATATSPKIPDAASSTEYSISSQTSSGSGSSSSSITASVSGGAAGVVSSTKHFVPVTQAPTKTLHKRTGNAAGAAAGVGKNNKQKLITINDLRNHSREALSHEGSQRDSVVYLSDNSGYIPVTSLRTGRPGSPLPAVDAGSVPYHSSNTGPSGTDLEAWRTDLWDRDYTTHRFRHNSTRVQHIEAECQDDYMKIRVGFNGSFSGLLYSAGYAYDPDCMYINGSGRDYYEFYIQLNRCGTLGKNAIHDKSRENPTNFMWNTITVQYNPLIEEEFDEHFKVTCEYGYDFWKTVTFPFLDVEVATGNPVVFTLSPPECYMEIRNGYGIAGNRVTGPVRVGDPLTLIIYMRSKYDGFDIVVNDCYAHNGATKRIQLIDEYGCPVDDKLISRFRGTWSDTGVYETQVYAYMKTFRFTGSPALYIECDVRMCHGRCPSQPCHWRNLKSVSKRDVSNQTIELTAEQTATKTTATKDAAAQSDNISLFQSLRVLQEGEEETNDPDAAEIKKVKEPNETCVKTAVLSTISAGGSMLLCILLVSLMLTCSKLRNRKKDAGIYDAYVNHKGQID